MRATASGATALAESATHAVCSEAERRVAAAESLRCDEGELEAIELTRSLTAYTRRTQRVVPLRRVRERRDVRVVDERGAVRLAVRDPRVTLTTAGTLDTEVLDEIEAATNFGDVGRALPALYLAARRTHRSVRRLDEQRTAAALAAEEIEGCDPSERVALVIVAREA